MPKHTLKGLIKVALRKLEETHFVYYTDDEGNFVDSKGNQVDKVYFDKETGKKQIERGYKQIKEVYYPPGYEILDFYYLQGLLHRVEQDRAEPLPDIIKRLVELSPQNDVIQTLVELLKQHL